MHSVPAVTLVPPDFEHRGQAATSTKARFVRGVDAAPRPSAPLAASAVIDPGRATPARLEVRAA